MSNPSARSTSKHRRQPLVNTSGWTALVAFAGVGRAGNVDVSDWLADKIGELGFSATPIDELMNALLTADEEWLRGVTDPVLRRHTFSVAGFVGSGPVFGLVSNFEDLAGRVEATARPILDSWLVDVRKPVIFVAGQRHEVPRPERRRLRHLAERDPDPQVVYDALANVNRAV